MGSLLQPKRITTTTFHLVQKIQFVDHSTYEITWGQTGENSSALRTSFQGATVTGGINLKLFTGAAAKGIPEEIKSSWNEYNKNIIF